VDPGRENRVSPEFVEVLHQIETAQESDVLEQALTAARERLSMDAAYITTIDSQHQTIDAVLGDAHALGLQGAMIPVEETYCIRMLRGDIPNVVPDTRVEPAVRDLDLTRDVGAYIGVPVTLSDGRIHGTLCCASHTARAELGPEELGFMQILADIVAVRVEQAQGNLARLTARFRGRQRERARPRTTGTTTTPPR
jgi:GAF domain-containing protein